MNRLRANEGLAPRARNLLARKRVSLSLVSLSLNARVSLSSLYVYLSLSRSKCDHLSRNPHSTPGVTGRDPQNQRKKLRLKVCRASRFIRTFEGHRTVPENARYRAHTTQTWAPEKGRTGRERASCCRADLALIRQLRPGLKVKALQPFTLSLLRSAGVTAYCRKSVSGGWRLSHVNLVMCHREC